MLRPVSRLEQHRLRRAEPKAADGNCRCISPAQKTYRTGPHGTIRDPWPSAISRIALGSSATPAPPGPFAGFRLRVHQLATQAGRVLGTQVWQLMGRHGTSRTSSTVFHGKKMCQRRLSHWAWLVGSCRNFSASRCSAVSSLKWNCHMLNLGRRKGWRADQETLTWPYLLPTQRCLSQWPRPDFLRVWLLAHLVLEVFWCFGERMRLWVFW